MAQAISESVAPVFEQEANRHLTVYFPACLQGCGVTDFRGREITQGDTVIRQLDSFAYMTNDTLARGTEARTNGLSLLVPNGMVFRAAAGAPANNLQSSPGAQERAPLAPTKYVVGEAYSGSNPVKLRAKLHQLEGGIETLRARHVGRGNVCNDITCLVGAALLICSCGSRPRAQAVRDDSASLLGTLSQADHPHLWRLAEAGRLFCLVMSANESPQSVIARQTHQALTSLQDDVSAMQNDLGSLQDDVSAMQNDLGRLMRHFGLS